eukprot:5705741-Amphidinium_carterae.1
MNRKIGPLLEDYDMIPGMGCGRDDRSDTWFGMWKGRLDHIQIAKQLLRFRGLQSKGYISSNICMSCWSLMFACSSLLLGFTATSLPLEHSHLGLQMQPACATHYGTPCPFRWGWASSNTWTHDNE